jgi:heptosyltransferase-3
MRVSKKINDVRRKLMRSLTSSVGQSHASNAVYPTIGISVQRVLIVRPNARLGNLLLMTPLIQDVAAVFPNCKIDLFVKGNAAPVIFKNFKNIDRIIQLPGKPFKQFHTYLKQWLAIRKYTYDLVINVDPDSSSGRLSSQFSKSAYKIFGAVDEQLLSEFDDYHHIAKKPAYNFRKYINQLGYFVYERPVPKLNLKLTAFEIARGKLALDRLADPTKKTICLFTYATGAKCYDGIWWQEFYEKLLQNHPDHHIIEVLPLHGASQFAGKMPCFYSKDIREIASLFSNVTVFIGADSGMMHLASAAQTTVIGLFHITDAEKYRPYGNHSIAIDTKIGNIDNWFERMSTVIRLAGLREKDADSAATA